MPLEQEQFEAPSFSHRGGVGDVLRQMREQRGQDLESVARALRIRHPYLVAIEESRYRDLPGAPYASGFVRSYSEYLGLDANEMLRRFREESGNMGKRSELVFPTPVSEGGFPAAILIGVVIILAAIVYGVWYFYQWRHNSTAESVSVLPDRLAALIHAPGGEDKPETPDATGAQAAPTPSQPATTAQTPAPTPAPAPQATTDSSAAQSTATTAPAPAQATQPAPAAPAPAPATAAATPPANTAAPATTTPAPVPAPTQTTAAAPTPPAAQQQMEVAKAEPEAAPPAPANQPASTVSAPPAPELASPSRVVLRATEDCWVEIRDNTGAVVTSRLMHKGDALPVPPRQGLTLTVGNAGALTVLLDGSPMPPLGKTGMVRHDVPLDPERGVVPATAANPAPAPTNNDSPNN